MERILTNTHTQPPNPFMDYLPEMDEIDVSSMPDADFVLGKVAELDRQIEEVNQSANTQIDRIKLWKETRSATIERQKEYYLTVLHHYLISTGNKTEKLVNGTLALRKQQDQIVIVDKDIIIKDGRFVREKLTRYVDRIILKKHIQSTGEIPDGVTVNPREPKFTYKIT